VTGGAESTLYDRRSSATEALALVVGIGLEFAASMARPELLRRLIKVGAGERNRNSRQAAAVRPSGWPGRNSWVGGQEEAATGLVLPTGVRRSPRRCRKAPPPE